MQKCCNACCLNTQRQLELKLTKVEIIQKECLVFKITYQNKVHKKFRFNQVTGLEQLKLNYVIPGDITQVLFIVLTILSKNSKIKLKYKRK